MIASRPTTSNYMKTGEITKRTNRLMARYNEFGKKNIYFKERFTDIQNELRNLKNKNEYKDIITYDSKNNMYKLKSPRKKTPETTRKLWERLTKDIEFDLPQKKVLDRLIEEAKARGYNYDYNDAYKVFTRITSSKKDDLREYLMMLSKKFGKTVTLEDYVVSIYNTDHVRESKNKISKARDYTVTEDDLTEGLALLPSTRKKF